MAALRRGRRPHGGDRACAWARGGGGARAARGPGRLAEHPRRPFRRADRALAAEGLREATALAEAVRGTSDAMQSVEPFPIAVGEEVLADLRELLDGGSQFCGRADPAGERLDAIDERREPDTDESANRAESDQVEGRDFSAPPQTRVTQRTRSVSMSESLRSEAVMPAITAHLAADLSVDGEQMPVFVWTIDHPAGRVLVDTGMIDSRPEIEDMSPTPHPENIPRDVACIINTHLHYDHCGGNRLFPGVPIHVQARELADARSLDNYTFREWVDFDGATYVEHEGEVELLPGIRLLPTPGHTDGHQSVLVETGGRPVVVGGDVAVWFGELDEPHTEGQLRVRALDPELVWLAHEREPWRPRTT